MSLNIAYVFKEIAENINVSVFFLRNGDIDPLVYFLFTIVCECVRRRVCVCVCQLVWCSVWCQGFPTFLLNQEKDLFGHRRLQRVQRTNRRGASGLI